MRRVAPEVARVAAGPWWCMAVRTSGSRGTQRASSQEGLLCTDARGTIALGSLRTCRGTCSARSTACCVISVNVTRCTSRPLSSPLLCSGTWARGEAAAERGTRLCAGRAAGWCMGCPATLRPLHAQARRCLHGRAARRHTAHAAPAALARCATKWPRPRGQGQWPAAPAGCAAACTVRGCAARRGARAQRQCVTAAVGTRSQWRAQPMERAASGARTLPARLTASCMALNRSRAPGSCAHTMRKSWSGSTEPGLLGRSRMWP